MMKTCSKCNQEKPESEFPLVSKASGKLRAHCKVCKNQSGKEYYLENRDAVLKRTCEYGKLHPEIGRAKVRAYRERHPDRVRANTRRQYARRSKEDVARASREWRAKNPERSRELQRKSWKARKDRYIARHPEYYNEQAGKRRAAFLNAIPPWLTKDQHNEIRAIYREAKRMILLTGTRYEVDHIEPLRGKTSCGLHVPWNLRVITRSENARKHNKLTT